VEALLAAPVGVAWLAELERAQHDDPWRLDPALPADPRAVASAADAVAGASFGSLLVAAIDASIHVGPWTADAPRAAAAAYAQAGARRTIAEAIDARFGDALHAPLAAGSQEWWWSAEGDDVVEPAGEFVLGDVYGAGQFSWAGVWTVSAPPREVHVGLADVHEIFPLPISRWRLPVRDTARIRTIHRPEDWAELVVAHPAPARAEEEGWELPGGRDRRDRRSLDPLLATRDQRGARAAIRHHLVPDWSSVACEVDGVHVSWAGFLTGEGCVTDLADGDVAMLRYWFSERTHWLRDIFGEPEPLAGPHLVLEDGTPWGAPGGGSAAADVRTDPARAAADLRRLRRMLRR